MAKSPERRSQHFRRQVNQVWSDPDGRFSISKFIATWAQISILAHLNVWFEKTLDKPETLLIILSFLIAPDMIKKALSMKLGGAK
jgi:hypothetical protein